MFYLLFIYLWILYFLKDKIKDKTLALLALVPVFTIIFVKFGFGADYLSYEHIYNSIRTESIFELARFYRNIDFGFKLMMWPFKALGISFHLFFAIINSMCLVFTGLWIKDNSSNKLLSLILFISMFFTVWILSAARQAIVLSISLYLFFNKKINLSFPLSVLLIVLLSTVHTSVLVMIPLIVMNHYKWNKKSLLIFFVTCLIIGMFPFHLVAPLFKNVPFVGKIFTNYLSEGRNLIEFNSIVRLFFFILVYSFYDKYDEGSIKVVNRFLFGTGVYFLFKFSEITAARLSIYTFMSIVLILPDIVSIIEHKFNFKTSISVLLSFLLFGYTGVFYQKELTTMRSQSSNMSTSPLVSLDTIFKSDYSNYDSIFSFRTYLYKTAEAKRNEFLADYKLKVTEFSFEDSYIVVEHYPDRYRILNQEGRWLDRKVFTSIPYFQNGVLVNNSFEDNYFFSHIEYEDLSNLNRSNDEMADIIDREFTVSNQINYGEVRIETTSDDIPNEMKQYYQNLEYVDKVDTNLIKGIKDYYIMRVSYKGEYTFIYLDGNFQPIFDFVFTSAKPFDENGLAVVRTSTDSSGIAINIEGDILWWGPR